MKLSSTVTELWSEQESKKKKNNQRGITWKLRKGELPFLYTTQCLDLIHISMKLHEDILNNYRVMARTRMFGKKIIKGA